MASRKMEEGFGDRDYDESGSTSEEEDEDASALTPSLERDIFKTLSCLKRDDPKIYDKNVKFYETAEPSPANKKKKTKEEKPMFLKDFQRKIIVENEGRFEDDDDDDEVNYNDDDDERPPTYYEEQESIRQSFKKALGKVADDDEENEEDDMVGGLMKKREKTKEEMNKEETDYVLWLKGQDVKMDDDKNKDELRYLREYWNNPKLDQGEAFLRDYVLNRRYLERDDPNYVPTYDEVVHDDDDLSGDEKTIKEQEEYEHKYNFRFEEPDQEFIKQYPRKIEDSLRRTDDKRKKKRQERKERKKAEKQKKKQELVKVKAQKRQEIMEKLEKLKLITGNSSVGFDDNDLEDDFDPDDHEKKMQEVFNEEYYNEDGCDEKPVFSDEEIPEVTECEEEEMSKSKKKRKKKKKRDGNAEASCEDPDFNMDCDYDPTQEPSSSGTQASSSKKKGKGKKGKGKQLSVTEQEDEFLSHVEEGRGESSNALADSVDEYFKLHFEDLIGDTPCRFNYRKVVPNDFGLTTQEILEAEDAELDRWCPLAKTYEYKSTEDEKCDVRNYQSKVKHKGLKEKVLSSIYSKKQQNTEQAEKAEGEEGEKKKKRRRGQPRFEGRQKQDSSGWGDQGRGRKRNYWEANQSDPVNAELGVSDARLEAYGINPRKYKRKIMYSHE